MCAAKRKALIVGGGVGGLTAARAMRRQYEELWGWRLEAGR